MIVAIVVVFVPLSKRYDLADFLRAGHAILAGHPVYPQPGTAAVYSGSAFVYPYFSVWPFVALATLPASTGGMIFFTLSLAAVLTACLVSTDGDPWPAMLILASSFAITGLQLGSLSPLLFAGAVTMWRLREREIPFALLAAPVIAVKLFLAPLLVWLLIARRWRAFACSSTATAVLLLGGFVFGPIGITAYVRMLSALGTHEARAGFGVVGALLNLGMTPGAAQALAMGIAATVVAAAYVHYRRSTDERVLFCGALLACLLLTPVLWSHYLLCLAAIPLVLGARRVWFVILALASWLVAPAHGVHLHTGPLAMVNVGVALATAAVLSYAIWSTAHRAPHPAPRA